MSQLINVPLESYLLAQKSAPIDCLICGRENCSSAERCTRCSAPIALSRLAGEGRRAPRLISVVGASGVGKTVFLGTMMDMLVRRVGGLRAAVRGPHSIGLQQQTTTALASGGYPDPTHTEAEHWNWVHCQIECSRRGRPTEIVFADAAGEAWAAEADHPGAYAALSALLAKSAGLIVVADAQRLHAGDHSDDFVVHKLLSQLEEKPGRWTTRTNALAKRPLALVFTKADVCQSCLDRPREFAEAHAASLLNDCEARFANIRVFGASVAGCSAIRELNGRRRNVPLRIEPQGVVEPFGWLLSQIA
ncbi:MAG: hypothetical protein AAGF31_01685 [Planctomycetota bacterium]